MNIVYLISIILTFMAARVVDDQLHDAYKNKGYKFIFKKKPFKQNIKDYIKESLFFLIPVFNIIAISYISANMDELVDESIKDFLKDGTIVKIDENEVIEENDRYTINNILEAKSIQEVNTPKWKKVIQSIYSQFGDVLKKHNIIKEENDYQYNRDLYYDFNKTKKL